MSPSPAWADSRVLGTSRRSGKDWAVKFDGDDQAATTARSSTPPAASPSLPGYAPMWSVGWSWRRSARTRARSNSSTIRRSSDVLGRYASDTVNALATPSPACGTEPVQPGVWVHLAGVYDAGSTNQLSLYVNGVRKGVGMANASVWSASGPLMIGAARNGAPTGLGSTAPSARPGSGTGSSTRRRTCPRSWRPVRVGQWDMDSDDQDEPRESGDSSDYRTPLTLGPAPAANWTTEGFNGSTALRFDGISGAAQTSGPVLRTDRRTPSRRGCGSQAARAPAR